MMPPPMTTASALSGSSGLDCMVIKGAGILFSWPETCCFCGVAASDAGELQGGGNVVSVRADKLIGAHKIG
jgi:hypothetical protein